MASNNESELQAWVDERMKTLLPEREWRPDTGRGLARLRERVLRGSGSRARPIGTVLALRGCLALEDDAWRAKGRPYIGIAGLIGKWNWSPAWAWSLAAIGAAAIVVLMLAAPSPRVLAQR